MRARKKKWAPAELAGNPYIIREPEGRVRPHFANDAPLHVEIGCGKGRFITETARRNPHINYIAIEREAPIIAAAARAASEAASDGATLSLAFLHMDVEELRGYFAAGDIQRLYINFCDPWPRKKKRAKRRLTHDDFLAIYRELAIPEIFFKTDNRILFEFSLESFNRCGWLMQNISLDLHANMPEDNIVTEYEAKFAALGPIYRLEAYTKA